MNIKLLQNWKLKAVSSVILLLTNYTGYSQNSTNAASTPIQGPRVYFRAPDAIPGTLPEMRTVSYWAAKMQSPDNVILTADKIQKMNADYWVRMQKPDILDPELAGLITKKLNANPGLYTANPNLYSKSPAEVAALTKDMVGKELSYLHRGKYGNMMAVEYSKKEISDLEDEMALTQIMNTVSIQPGITVVDAELRIIPVLRPGIVGISNKGKGRWDMWNLDVVPIGSPVQILHVSKSGASVFVFSANGYGWISATDVAMSDRKTTEQFRKAGNFVICTGDIVSLYTDASCKYASAIFRMGNRLPVVAGNSRQVQVPVRLANGKLSVQQAWLAPNADVHKGYLPYTRKNIVVQEMKLLDNVYDWTGGWLGRNHATSLRDIYATFGFTLPGCGELMSAFNDKVNRVHANEGKEAEYKAILANDPFTTLQICSSGHSQIYMGNNNGTPVSYDNNGYGYVDDANREVEIRRTAIVPITIPNYFLQEDIIFVSLK